MRPADACRSYARGKFRLPVITFDAAGCHDAPALTPGRLRQQVGDCGPFALIVDLVDVVDEQYCSATRAKLIEQFRLGAGPTDRMSHREPTAGNNPAAAQSQDAAFRLQTHRKMLHDRGFTDTGPALYQHHGMLVEDVVRFIDQSVPREAHTTNGFVDFIEGLLGGFREALIDRTQIGMRCEPNAMLLLQERDDCGPIRCTGRTCAGADVINEDRPKIVGAVGLVGAE